MLNLPSTAILEQYNQPSIIASVGAASLLLLPQLDQICTSPRTPWFVVKAANLLVYALNYYAASQPGRLDGKSASRDKDSSLGPRGNTLLAPAGWAFTIWAPIFLGELIATAAAFLFISRRSLLVPVLRQVSAGFIVSQILQTLWAASFRPKYAESPAIAMSGFLLLGTAVALGRSHAAFTVIETAEKASEYHVNWLSYVVFLLPLTLHFGWITAAALVNANGTLSLLLSQIEGSIINKPISIGKIEKKQIAYGLAAAGYVSVVAATIVGVSLTRRRDAPLYGAVIAWALVACAQTMKERSSSKQSSKDKEEPGLFGTVAQKWLCLAGAACTGTASIQTIISGSM